MAGGSAFFNDPKITSKIDSIRRLRNQIIVAHGMSAVEEENAKYAMNVLNWMIDRASNLGVLNISEENYFSVEHLMEIVDEPQYIR